MRQGATLIALAMSILLCLGPVEPARSQDATSTTYEGTHEAGGPVRLVVDGEPVRITSFEIEGVAGGGCSWDTISLENWGGEIVVAEQRFEATNPDGDVLQGVWISDPAGARRIEGTIQVRDPGKGCETPPLRWVAAPLPHS
jgi:hypothetical protein